MRVRFGYVAIALNVPQGSPNKTITVKTIEKIPDHTIRNNRLRLILEENLHTTLRILRYNVAHDIHVYRLTSKTVPLATHPITTGWNYIEDFQDEWREIGDMIKKHNMRISAHPDHYTLLNSQKSEVLESALRDLDYHVSLFKALGLSPAPQLVLHIGGLYNNKQTSIARFINTFNQLPEGIRLRLMLENDDKSYSAIDVLTLCQHLNCPMVLDIHHHTCHNNGEDLAHLWPDIVNTWGNSVPKIHASSPKNSKDFRSHADFVQVNAFLPFLKTAKELNRDFDVMVEAKQKDVAMFHLLDELEKIPGVKRVGNATIEYL
ncbi:MAG: uvsE [Firmicutes bacterium]|nr:uvsE [Bacillota bacterium]